MPSCWAERPGHSCLVRMGGCPRPLPGGCDSGRPAFLPGTPPPCCRGGPDSSAPVPPSCDADLTDPHVVPSHSPCSEGPSFRKGTVLPELLPLLPGSASAGDAVCRPTAGPAWQAAARDALPAVTSCGGSGGSSSLASCGVNRKRGCVRTVAVSCERRGRPRPPL